MADVTKREFNIDVSYTGGATTTIWSSANQGISGKITAVTLNLVNHSISTNIGIMLAHSVIQLYSRSTLFDEQVIEVDKKYIENQKIQYDDVKKIYPSSKFANNGNCEIDLKIASDMNLRGNISGTITVSYTEDVEEQNNKTILGLDQNALTDWFKGKTSDKVKFGVSATNQYPIQMNFASGKSQTLVWTNKGVNSDYIESISISLQLNVENEASAQRTIDLDFNAAYGSESETDNIGMWILSAGQTRTINTAKSYEVSDMVNDGLCLITIKIKNTENVSGSVSGVIILKTKSAGISDTGDTTTDTGIQSILDMLSGSEDYSVAGSTSGTGLDIDSFLSNYSGEGYEDDMSLLSSDNWNTAALSNDVAGKVLELEQRITNLEERMNILNVGGSDIDWYDGGGDGSDDAWGIDEWYKQNENRITQTEEEGNVSHTLFILASDFNEIFFQTNDYTSISQSVQNFNYFLLMSYRYKGELCNDKQFVLAFVIDDGINQKEIVIDTFTLGDEQIKSSDYRGSITQTDLLSEGNCKIKGVAYFKSELTQEEKEDIVANFEGKVSGNIDYQLQEQKSDEKLKGSSEITVPIDVTNFTGSQVIFSYDAQSRNENLQRVEITLTLNYNYDITQSQACVGQKLKLDFNSVAVHPGFANQLTYFNIGEDEITSSSKSSKQKVFKATYTLSQFANNGNCAFSVDFVTPDISAANLVDFKQNFSGTVTGTVKYSVVPN